MEPHVDGTSLPKTAGVNGMKVSLDEFSLYYAPLLRERLRGVLADPKNYQYKHQELFGAIYRICWSRLMANAIQCFVEVMNEFFDSVRAQLLACETPALVGALLQFNTHYLLAEKCIQPPLRPLETLPGSKVPFSTAGWFKQMRADRLYRDPALQKHIAEALYLVTLDSVSNYDDPGLRNLIISLWDAEKQFAQCNIDLFKKYVPALSARPAQLQQLQRQIQEQRAEEQQLIQQNIIAHNPNQFASSAVLAPIGSSAWAMEQARLLGIEDDDFNTGATHTNQNGGAMDVAMDVDDDVAGNNRKRKRDFDLPADLADAQPR